jgi:cell division septum initiation protein DivIVA
VTISTPHNQTHTTGGVPSPAGSAFDIVRRGYDRDQVDAQLRELRERLAASEAARQAAEQHARATESELRAARSQGNSESSGMSQESFGFRAEKILRLAEHEAADVRSRAANEAAAMVEKARADAERHRHEVEQSLIARTATVEQEATRRKVELDERERQIGEQAVAARENADRLVSQARRQSEQIRQDAQLAAEQERLKAEKAIRVRRDAAEQELARLRGLHDEVRSQLARLLESLAGEFGDRSGEFHRAGEYSKQTAEPVTQHRVRPQIQSADRPRPHPRPQVAQHGESQGARQRADDQVQTRSAS